MTWIRSWALWQAPRGVILVVLATVAVACASVLWNVEARPSAAGRDWVLLVVLVVVGDVTDRVKERIGRVVRSRAASGGADITVSTDSVWIVVAIVTLPVHLVAVVAVLLSLGTDVRWHRSRPADAPFPLRRLVFNAAIVLTSSTWAAHGYHAVVHVLHGPQAGALPVGGVLLGGLAATLLMGVIQMGTLGLIMIGCGEPVRAVPRLLVSSAPDELGLGSLGLLLAVAWQTDPLLLLAGMPVVMHLQQALLHRQLREATERDPKTGLLSVGHWREQAERALVAGRSRGGEVGVLLLDLDHFKAVNDTYGHLVGDELLVAAAQAMRAAVREGDLVGRFGGEEFVVLLPGADATVAGAVAERLRLAVADLTVTLPDGDGQVQVTASVGGALFPVDGYSLDELLTRADRALYVAKHAGRDRVAFATR